MDDATIAHCRLLDATDVAEALRLPKADEQYKWGCPNCGSSDALHCWPGGDGRFARCYSCETGYDAIALTEATLGANFQSAVQWLAEEFGFAKTESEESTDYRKRIQKKVKRRRREREKRKRERRQQARPILNRLYRRLALGRSGREYVESRGIPWKLARHVGIRSVGTDRQWQHLRDSFEPDELVAAGLAGEDDETGERYPVPWRTPFLVFDYRNKDGSLDLLRFRHLDGGGPKYLSPLKLNPTGPYLRHSYSLSDDHDVLYVCEGEFDALSVAYADHPAVASPGNATWRAAWCKPFRWFERVVVLCDGDEAGRRFSENVFEGVDRTLGRDWAEERLRRRVFDDDTDVNDALQNGILKDVLHAA